MFHVLRHIFTRTLTPPSNSRSPPLAGGPRRISIIITHALYFEIYTTPLEGIQLMSIAGYEAFVCVCFFAFKTLCSPSYGCRGTPVVARMCLYCAKNYYLNYQKVPVSTRYWALAIWGPRPISLGFWGPLSARCNAAGALALAPSP